jgi:hypothetical protein
MAIWELGSIKSFAHNHKGKKGFSGSNDTAMLKKKEAMMRHSMKERRNCCCCCCFLYNNKTCTGKASKGCVLCASLSDGFVN